MEIKNARATERHVELNQDLAYVKVTCGADTQQSNTKTAAKKHKARVLILHYGASERDDVQKVITLVNTSAVTNGHQPLNQLDVEDILNLYPDNATE